MSLHKFPKFEFLKNAALIWKGIQIQIVCRLGLCGSLFVGSPFDDMYM